jgi:hypothetical protein
MMVSDPYFFERDSSCVEGPEQRLEPRGMLVKDGYV